MNDSILNSVKEDVGLDPGDTDFDDQLIRAINTSLFVLYQIGFGPSVFSIHSVNDTWDDLKEATYSSDKEIAEIKTYISSKAKQYFDPAGVSSQVNNALNEQNAELEWRINAKYDRGWEDDDE